MKSDYLCPHCNSHLVCTDYLILTLESEIGDKRGLLLMNVGLGNYSYLNHPSIKFEDGETVEFYCPVCRANLKVPEINDKLVRVVYVDEHKKRYDVYFSRVTGEHSTFKVNHDDIIEQYGEDASAYVSYFTAKLKKKMKL
ncbi:MAG: hypothetical protein V1733_02070 [bacterium]